MKKNILYKIANNQNDFLVELRKTKKLIPSSWIRKICHRRFLGADGFISLVKKKEGVFVWDFYNCDGKKASLCGNALLALTSLIENKKWSKKKEFIIETQAFNVLCKKLKNKVQIEIPKDHIEKKHPPLKLQIDKKPYWLIHSGTFHLLSLNYKKRNAEDALDLMKKIKKKYDIETNITFYEKTKTKIKAVSFEKGVNNWTPCCGSAAMALGFHCFQGQNPIEVEFPGGSLFVKIGRKKIYLQGTPSAILEIKMLKE